MNISKFTISNVEELAVHYRNRTVLVTGATGMLGQNVVALLLALNNELKTNIHVIAHGRNQEKAEIVFADYKGNPNLSYLISDIKCLDTDEHVDFIVHTASVTGGSKQHLDFPMTTISTALEGAKRVLDLALKNKAAAVFLSSLEVYGFTGTDKEILYETDGGYIDCTNVRSCYSESKRMCECMFASYAKQYGIHANIARLTATFGRGVSKTDKRVFAQFAQSIINKQDIVLKSTGESVRDYCDAEDAAAALLYIMSKGEAGEAYNVANMDTEISIKDMALMFTELYPESGSKLVFDLSVDATKLGYNAVMRNVINSDKLLALGWKPVYGMEDIVKHLVESMKIYNNMESKKYNRGFTVGTFDMFHRGHLNLFRQAKDYCDYLIVGVHSDEWVMHCKNRPTVISYEDRADIVGAIRYVDEVVKNETRSKMEAWEKLHFDVAFIGDDWKGTEVWNKIEAELKTVGCDVIYIPYTNGISTTQLRQKLAGTDNSKTEQKQ